MMAHYARIQDGIVVETLDTDGDIATMFHPDLTWVRAPGDVIAGWSYDGDSFTVPIVPAVDLTLVKDAASQSITEACLEAIDAGFSYAGDRYDSDLVSRTNIIGTATGVQAGIPLPEEFTWRTSDNENVPMDGAGVIALGAALLQHVNEQYSTSWQLKAQIEAATTPEEVKAIIWPTAT